MQPEIPTCRPPEPRFQTIEVPTSLLIRIAGALFAHAEDELHDALAEHIRRSTTEPGRRS